MSDYSKQIDDLMQDFTSEAFAYAREFYEDQRNHGQYLDDAKEYRRASKAFQAKLQHLLQQVEVAAQQELLSKLPTTTLYAAEWATPDRTPTEFHNVDVILATDLPDLRTQ